MEETVGFALVRAGMAHRARAQELLGAVGLHPGQEFLLRLLWREDCVFPSELADRLRVEPATVTKTLRRLERVGVIRREPDSEDGRRVRVLLTEQGRALEERTRAAWDQLERETVADLSDDERATLRKLLDRVRDQLGEAGC